MIDFSDTPVAFVFLTFVLGGVVKGVTGMGLPTVAMGLLATVMPAREAAALMLVPSLITNVWQLAGGPDPLGAMRRFWPMMTALGLATALFAGAMAADDAHYATTALGAALALYSAFSLTGKRLSVSAATERWANAPIGFLTGAVTGATGVAVIPSAPYLQALGLDKEDLVQALGLSFTVSTIALGIGLAAHGGLALHSLGGSAAAILPAAIGMALGQALRSVVSPATFRTIFFAGLLVLGIYLVIESGG